MRKKISIVAGLAILAFTTATASASGGLPPSGKIWFGKHYMKDKSGDLVIQGKQSTFHASGRIAWAAHFNQAAGTKTISVALYYEKSGKDVEKWRGPVHLRHSNSNEFANEIPVHDFVVLGATKIGNYKLAYFRGSHLLASGTFFLTN
jgi:hypothetical protein